MTPPFLRARAASYVLRFLSTLVRLERDVLRDLLDRIGPTMQRVATDAAAAKTLRSSLADFRDPIVKARQFAEDAKGMYKTNLWARGYLRLRVMPALDTAADHYEDLHALATSYLNEHEKANTVPWNDFARTVR